MTCLKFFFYLMVFSNKNSCLLSKTGGPYSPSGSRWCFLEAKEGTKEEEHGKSQSREGVRCWSKEVRQIESLSHRLGEVMNFCWVCALLAHTALTHLAGASSEAKSFNLPTLWHVGEKRDYGASNMRFQMLIQYHQNFGVSFLWMPSFKTQKERYPW